MGKKVLVLASNIGLWAEELQAPWDALKNAGFDLTLATEQGKTPLPLAFSMEAGLWILAQDPREPSGSRRQNQGTAWNRRVGQSSNDRRPSTWTSTMPSSPSEVRDRRWISPATQMYIGCLKRPMRAARQSATLCYAVGALVWARNPSDWSKSIIYGKQIVAHPKEWDFTDQLPYPLYGATPDNPGIDLVSPGFVYPLSPIVVDAVGPNGKVLSDPTTSRERPLVMYDPPFVTALSVESSKAFGEKLVEVLSAKFAEVGA